MMKDPSFRDEDGASHRDLKADGEPEGARPLGGTDERSWGYDEAEAWPTGYIDDE